MARYGLLADVHANLPALRAVLERLEAEDVDTLVCAGDLVGYGPHPNECVALLHERGVRCVAGNHDLIAAGRLGDEGAGRMARRSLIWTREHLSDAARESLAALPMTLATPDGVVVTHGVLDDPEIRVTTSAAAVTALDRLAEHDPDARFLIVGNTHRALAFDQHGQAPSAGTAGSLRLRAERRYLINPGSVGQSRERQPWARCAVLDTSSGELRFLSLRYDREAIRQALLAAGLPPAAAHRPPHARWLDVWRLPHRLTMALRRRIGRRTAPRH